MASRSSTPPPDDIVENIVDIGVAQEMQEAFLEYSYSVIYARALPDARDGLKPVQRRILFGMNELGLRPDRPHVKSSRIVGEVMGKYHPHGDSAIYDTLVRLAQPFTMRLPLVDGHGNFGSLDDGPAASRYTEARMAAAAMLMVAGLDEDTVDFVPNYDDTHQQPGVLPAAFPNLLVNGASGIAVGMATNMAPHNLVEVVAAARHLLEHPDCSLEDLMGFVPGPDLPGGGRIIGLDGIREAYLTGRGSFRTRATARVESITPRRKGIVVTELPYLVGPEKVIERIKDLVQAKKLAGISDVKDLTDRRHGLQLVIEVRSGFVPEAVLEELYRLAPLEESFGINNVALVERPAPHHGPEGAARGLRRVPHRRRPAAHGIPPRPPPGAAAPRRGPAHRDRRHRRGHPAHPLLRRRRHRQGAADGRLRPDRRAGHLHPRPAAAPAHQVLQDRAGEGAGASCGATSPSSAPSSATSGCCAEPCPTSSPRSPRRTAPRAGPSCSSRQEPGPPSPLSAAPAAARSRWPTTRAGCCCPRPACSRGPAPTTRCPARAPGPGTTSSSGRSAPRLAGRSAWSPPEAG